MKTLFLNLAIFLAFDSRVLANLESSQWSQVQAEGIQYWKYEPAVHSSRTGLMLNLHGCTQHASDLKNLGNWEETAEAADLVVIIPDVPNGGVVAGCWDYYGTDQTPTNKNNGILIKLIEDFLLKNTEIDRRRVYVSGISSGASEAMLLGCLRPDLFKGVGLNSGAAIGTDKTEVYQPKTTAHQVAELCLKLAGDKASFFRSQMTSVIHGDRDFIVNVKHSELIVSAFKEIYQTRSQTEFDLSHLKGTFLEGQGILYSDANQRPRLSEITNNGLGHAWASGKGSGSTVTYINPHSVNYPAYLNDFFNQPHNE